MLPASVLRRVVTAVVVTGVVATTAGVATPAAVPTANLLAGPGDPQVLVVSLDGLNPDALTRLGRARAPHLWRLLDEGAGTLEARTQVEMTVTLPNHTSMVTGRRVERRQAGHGVTWNDDRLRPRTVQRAARHRVDSVFSRLESAGRSAAVFSTKTKFALFDRSWPAGVDRMVIREEDDDAVVLAVRQDLAANDRAFTFLHLGAADQAGHAYAWMSPQYLEAVLLLDRLVGSVLTDVDADHRLADLTIVLTADHGGPPGATRHDDVRRRANYRVPFVVWGPGIERADLYAINPGYRAPGTAQPGLHGKQPVRNGNAANLALDLLGVDPVPGSVFGTDRPLRVVAAP